MQEGRSWRCIFCERSYLSSNSLVYHCRMKHRREETLEAFVRSQFKSAMEQRDAEQACLQPQAPEEVAESETVLAQALPKKKVQAVFSSVFRQLTESNYLCTERLAAKNERADDTPHPIYRLIVAGETIGKKNGKRASFSCDQAFTAYLLWLSKCSDSENYRLAVMHIIMYHDCLNEIGPSKLKKILNEEVNSNGNALIRSALELNERKREFCSVVDSEIIPEICNEFILSYIYERKKSTRIKLPRR